MELAMKYCGYCPGFHHAIKISWNWSINSKSNDLIKWLLPPHTALCFSRFTVLFWGVSPTELIYLDMNYDLKSGIKGRYFKTGEIVGEGPAWVHPLALKLTRWCGVSFISVSVAYPNLGGGIFLSLMSCDFFQQIRSVCDGWNPWSRQ